MDTSSTQRISEEYPRFESTDASSALQQDGDESYDPLEDSAVSVLTSLVTEEHAQTPAPKATSIESEIAATFATLERKWTHRWGSASLDILGAFASLLFLGKCLSTLKQT
jgi:hypothetical protein